MLLTNIFALITLATARVLTEPCEEVLAHKAKPYHDWKCVRYDWPHCDQYYYPMCCSGGWGDRHCDHYCEFRTFLSALANWLTSLEQTMDVTTTTHTAATNTIANGTRYW